MAMPNDPSASKNLVSFIGILIRRAAMDPSVPYAALLLLQRLKYRYPTARAIGQHLYFAAFMLASKMLCDTDLTVQSWLYSSQWSFTGSHLLKMERELCQYLYWDLTFDFDTLSNFQLVVRNVYGRDRDIYPAYSLIKLSPRLDVVSRQRGVAAVNGQPLPQPVPARSGSAPCPVNRKEKSNHSHSDPESHSTNK
ncbi:hypothetical protein CC1G_10145 [Coprinopsis cinerea okayama7|uniref:Cyclin N-terminal domain-containing protein n=1 Tax=Coprinopsis cinerea (strain Okayama-7 / 130 / ATCC MYA-4618 / FGSC 9003) TaxID=240176 RepID=A8PED5_COPC7|nr:hypothetical protein CC1G_10145 [Coprinopsis cinerea okayama7\|eukprot:XP_001840771.2 hypothetical protein CC1G_10145 [Coprinopsis cinerea okayama7\